jgi:alpha-tubulin suppressor-like RCC1 family protein
VTVQGTAYCWGQNLAGQLGDGSLANQDIPVQVLAP